MARGSGFTFKQFHIDHSRCAMKVGTDGTLLGAWVRLPDTTRSILDIGTGSGLIAIMTAQRTPEAHITAIDIDADCVAQAHLNAEASPWSDRISVLHTSLQNFTTEERFDVIVSNPPYFIDSLTSPDAGRTTARHTATLPFEELVSGVKRLLTPDGRFSLILPTAEAQRFLSAARGVLFLSRRCDVKPKPSSDVKRVMMEFSLSPQLPPTAEQLTIESDTHHDYTYAYRALTQDFYLKM